MKVHIRVHTNDRPYHCPYKDKCNKAFKTKSQLRDHILKHTQIKKFICPVCKACFSRKIRLKIHLMIHRGEKPFECNVCKKKFREKSNYNFHMKKHTPKNEDNFNKIKINEINNLNKIFDKKDLVMDKNINNFYIKDSKERGKSFDYYTNTNSQENNMNNNDNAIIQNSEDFQKKEESLNCENYSEMDNLKIFNDLMILNNINEIKYNNKFEKENIIEDENETGNHYIYQNQTFSLFNEQKDLYNNGEQNKFKNFEDSNNPNYYDDLDIKDIFNVNKSRIMFSSSIIESQIKNFDYYYQDILLNF